MKSVLLGFVHFKPGPYVESGEVLKCYYMHSFAKEREFKFMNLNNLKFYYFTLCTRA